MWAVVYVSISLTREGLFSRLMMVLVLGSWIALATLNRTVMRAALRRLRRQGRNQRHAAIVGAGRLGQKLYETIGHNPWTGITPVYFIDDQWENRTVHGLAVRGPVGQCRRIIDRHPVDIVFVALSKVSQEDVETVVHELSLTNVDLRVVPNLLSVQFLRHEVSQLDDLTIISLTDSPQRGWNSLFKYTFDIVGA